MSDQPHAIVEREGHVLTITMNRPEARNALSPEMLDIMAKTWDEVNSNPESGSRSSPAPAARFARART